MAAACQTYVWVGIQARNIIVYRSISMLPNCSLRFSDPDETFGLLGIEPSGQQLLSDPSLKDLPNLSFKKSPPHVNIRSTIYAPAIDNFLYQQYLKGDTTYFDFDTESIMSDSLSISEFSSASFHWDSQTVCKPMFPAFQYISEKLENKGLSIHLIISDHVPYVIPVWQLPRKSQTTLTRIVRKACSKFKISPSWMTALASVSAKKDLPKIFDAHEPDSYIVRRSILQHEVIFAAEGLTLLSIDHVYTLKQLLCTLSKGEWVSHSRDSCLSSCVALLQRINTIYIGKPMSKAYIARVYTETDLKEDALAEVIATYTDDSCTASIFDVTSELDFTNQYSKPTETDNNVPLAEIPNTSQDRSWDDLVSPVADADLSTLYSWESTWSASIAIAAPLLIAHPPIKKLREPQSPALPLISPLLPMETYNPNDLPRASSASPSTSKSLRSWIFDTNPTPIQAMPHRSQISRRAKPPGPPNSPSQCETLGSWDFESNHIPIDLPKRGSSISRFLKSQVEADSEEAKFKQVESKTKEANM